MATILLSAAGAVLGGAIGGSVLGLSTAVIGRAVGATLGRVIDQKLMGAGSGVVETGRVDRFRLMGASEGAPVLRLWGRTRVSGQVIWASQFKETVRSSGGSGKGAPKQPQTRSYSYSVSLAVALCEGEIARVGRIWADGVELDRKTLDLRVYKGTEDQLPDPAIAAIEGAEGAPAYRGIAYVVLENLDLTPFGNRVPQFSFEVVRPAQPGASAVHGVADAVRGVALVPGTGEYALATTPVHYSDGPGVNRTANVHSPGGGTDFAVLLEDLREELPNCRQVLIVVSWFGDDLRAAQCRIMPKVEQRTSDGVGMPWQVSGMTRATAEEVPRKEGRSVYGGTPADQSVVEAIRAVRMGGQRAVFYPFLLMDQLEGNGRTDPYTGAGDQPVLPWRGRITLSFAPGVVGSPDGTQQAADEVEAFFGSARVEDFLVQGSSVRYVGKQDTGYRRMILHYAHLCAAAGGVDAFCIGSELRGVTQIRGAGGSFPAVEALRSLAADVRSILGPETRIGYAADWSEYFGYHPQDGSGDVYFHLDPLWADPNIDFVGIDNYMPLSDWREGDDHADAAWGSIHSLDYLKANIEGGEGYDWYYASEEERRAQIRTPITDGSDGEPWVFRYKDIRSWWANTHHNRVGGIRESVPTPWQPQGKPIWFTEYGCPAVDKGTNEPNRFVDPKSSESALPRFSNGKRDDLIQSQYIRAIASYWSEPGRNPVSSVYGGPMLDLDAACLWAWDSRPYPFFPALDDVWSDAGNYARGHWLNGRASAQALASVVAEICERSGVSEIDVEGLYGLVRGYSVYDIETARSTLQPLMLVHGFEAIERDGLLVFRNRTGLKRVSLGESDLALTAEQASAVESVRAPAAEVAGRVRLLHFEADGSYEARAAEAVFPDDRTPTVSQTELPVVLTVAEGRAIVERWIAEARVARDSVRFALPPSRLDVGAGDIVELDLNGRKLDFRVDRVERAGATLLEAVRVESSVQQPSDAAETAPVLARFVPPLPVFPVFLDLPLMAGDEVPHAPHLAVSAEPWPGSVALYSSATEDAGYELNRLVERSAVVGTLESGLLHGAPGRFDLGEPVRVRISGGVLTSVSPEALLSGANLAAVGDGSPDRWEVLQFQRAELVEPGVYDLSVRLRGQLGTDAVMPSLWPVGSRFVLLDGAPIQPDVPLSARGLARHYRVGPALRGYEDPSYQHLVEAFAGIGLRPYSVVHLRARRANDGELEVSWVRRTRIDGDSWAGEEVPLGEARERYRVRVISGGTLLREEEVGTPSWTYAVADEAADQPAPGYRIEVAQVSDAFGPGPFNGITIHD